MAYLVGFNNVPDGIYDVHEEKMLPITSEDFNTLQQQHEEHDALLLERARYNIVRPQGKVPRPRTQEDIESLGSYTGDLVQEKWDGEIFREHKYWVQEEYVGLRGLKSFRYFQTNVVAPAVLAEVPDEIKNGKWYNPTKGIGWSEIHRIGTEWGKYAEDYIDPYRQAELRPLQTQRGHLISILNNRKTACVRIMDAMRNIKDFITLKTQDIDYSGVCENSFLVQSQLERENRILTYRLDTVHQMFQIVLSTMSEIDTSSHVGKEVGPLSASMTTLLDTLHNYSVE